MAYELLTDAPAFDRYASAETVLDQLSGRSKLPWEDEHNKNTNMRKLRMLKRSLAKCLSRDPAERPSAAELLASWEALFDSFGQEATVLSSHPTATSSVPPPASDA